MSILNDQYYIQLISEGDIHAFSTLVNRYKDLVFTLSVRMLKNREEAEEVAQDAFMKAYRSLNKFNGESKFSTWLYKVTFNACIDRLRRQKREKVFSLVDEFPESEVNSLITVLDRIENKEHKKLIRDCLGLLPGEDSFLLTLFYFEEQSLEEIAKVIGITPNNVKIRLYRSRKKLASILKEHLEPEILHNYERE
jgi:RNA polymerase sigma-70 factor, ECF subfamily